MGRGKAAAVAIAVLAILGWWLFRGGPAVPTGPTPEPGTVRPAAGETVSPGDTRTAAKVGGKTDPSKPVVPEDEERAAPKPEVPDVEGMCAMEDGTPLPGVLFWIQQGGLNDLVESGADGTFRMDRDVPAAIVHETAVPVSADGGALTEGAKGKWSVTATTDRLRVTFRDKSGWAHVRLVDAESGEPVISVKGIQVKWHIHGGWMSLGYGEDTAPGGWIPIPEGRLPEGGPGTGDGSDLIVNTDTVEVEFAMPGYEKGKLPLKDIRGRMTLRVRPVPPDATGEIVVPRVTKGIELPESRVTATLRWMGPEPAPRASEVLGLPTETGTFSLYDLPDGPWVIEFASVVDNVVVRGTKAFEKHGSLVDLGTIALVPAGKVVIRVLDTAGEPIPQAWAVIVRPEENPDQGRRLDLNNLGMVAVGDLEPGIGHRVVVKGLPRELEQTVVAAADAKPVEFRWTDKLVPCRITLIVDGKAVANPDGRTTIPAVVQESPLPRDKGAWKADGTFEAKLVPGTYRFSALATPKDGGALALFAADFTVPSGDAFEARVELQREAK